MDDDPKKVENPSQGDFYGLGNNVKESLFTERNIPKLHEWQEECLDLMGGEQNFIYSAPTSGGKTLVAEIQMLKCLLNSRKNVLFILPFVAIVQEKLNLFTNLALKFEFLVEEYAGYRGVIPPVKRRLKPTLYIATMEKADVMINSLIETNRLDEIGLTIIDELHMLGDPNRGHTIERIIVKIIDKCRIVAMSATISNIENIKSFLNADSYSSSKRPTDLKEYIVVDNEIFKLRSTEKEPPLTDLDSPVHFVRTLNTSFQNANIQRNEMIFNLTMEIIPYKSCIIFCDTKKNCERLVSVLANNFLRFPEKTIWFDVDRRLNLVSHLMEECDNAMEKVQCEGIKCGVAYHHAGLTVGERKIIEDGFSNGVINVLCCTSTLAAGVNLPAQRVIIRSPFMGLGLMSLASYKQMAGRAGRTGKDEFGESYLMCSSSMLSKIGVLFKGQLDAIYSQMNSTKLQDLIITLLHLKLACNKTSLEEILKKTFLYRTQHKVDVRLFDQANLIIKVLEEKKIINIHNECYTLTTFGLAVAKGGLPLEQSENLYILLKHSLNHMVLSSDIHILYLIINPDYIHQCKLSDDAVCRILNRLSELEITHLKALGIHTIDIRNILAHSWKVSKKSKVNMETVRRFLLALMIHKILCGSSLPSIAAEFDVQRGDLSFVLQSISSYAGSVIRFCEVLPDLVHLYSLLLPFPEHLHLLRFKNLDELMKLPCVKLGRASQLYKGGYKTIEALAKATPEDLVLAVDSLPYGQAKLIITAAKLYLRAKLEELQQNILDAMEKIKD